MRHPAEPTRNERAAVTFVFTTIASLAASLAWYALLAWILSVGRVGAGWGILKVSALLVPTVVCGASAYCVARRAGAEGAELTTTVVVAALVAPYVALQVAYGLGIAWSALSGDG